MISAVILICDRCDAREPLGGNPEARLKFLIASGWYYRERGENFCAACVKKAEQESNRGRL